MNRQKVDCALHYLKYNNKWFKDIDINSDWENLLSEDEDVEESVTEKTNDVDMTDCTGRDDEQGSDDEETDDDRLRGMALDTCLLQPIDIGQEVLDQYFNDVLCVASCEGNSPIRILMEQGNEAKCFPALFPTGQPAFHDKRDVTITLCRYFRNRLINVENRFAQSTQYMSSMHSICPGFKN